MAPLPQAGGPAEPPEEPIAPVSAALRHLLAPAPAAWVDPNPAPADTCLECANPAHCACACDTCAVSRAVREAALNPECDRCGQPAVAGEYLCAPCSQVPACTLCGEPVEGHAAVCPKCEEECDRPYEEDYEEDYGDYEDYMERHALRCICCSCRMDGDEGWGSRICSRSCFNAWSGRWG